MGRMFVRGDTHGNFDFLPYFCQDHNTTTDDVLVILGDAGILYYGGKKSREKYLKQYLTEQPITLFCIRGNHEDRPENRKISKVYNSQLNGYVYCEDEYPNILYALDGGTYRWNNKSILTIGGAYSVDKFYRLSMGWYWNINEQLTEDEMNSISNQYAGQRFDYVFTHTCPYSWQPTDLFLKSIDQSMVDNSMERWMEKFSLEINFGHWYFGHFHDDRFDVCGDGKVTMLFNEYKELI